MADEDVRYSPVAPISSYAAIFLPRDGPSPGNVAGRARPFAHFLSASTWSESLDTEASHATL